MTRPFRCSISILAAFSFCVSARAQTAERQYLSGLDKDHTVPWQFYCDHGQLSGRWSTIAVPSNWELQGFGNYTYGNQVSSAIAAARRKGGDVVAAEQPVHAKYKLDFTVPATWASKRIFLIFDGVMTDTEVFVNGQSAGPIHRGGYYRFRFDVSKRLKFGQTNLLEVNVADVSSDRSVNAAERHADYWNYGGIYRPVYLDAFPDDFIDRIAVDAQADGSLAVDVYPGDSTRTADRVEAQLLTCEGSPVGSALSAKFDPLMSPVTLKSRFNGIKAWSAETPNLYDLRVRLLQGGKTLHEMTRRIGFRTIEVRVGDGVYVNGRRILLKGCCRHTFWPESGRCTSPELSRLDVNLIKDMNMNAVRLTHYPTDPSFLAACDEQGLYVLDELAGWHRHYDTPVGRELVKEMVTRDVNHPCVLFWDNGNEGGWNTNLDGEFGKYDPQQRQVLHPWQLHGGINTRHYPTLAMLKQLAAGPDVFMPTEFNHGLYDGGAGAGLREAWDVMLHSDKSAGGFIWAYVDEAVVRTDKHGMLDSAGNQAPDGILGPHREKEASFYTVKELWSPVQIAPPNLDSNFDGTLRVENHYDFTGLRDCKIQWQLRQLPALNENGSNFTVVARGDVGASDVAPHGVGNLKLALPKDWMKSDALAVTVTDPYGRELWTWVWPILESRRHPELTPVAGRPGRPAPAGPIVLRGGGTEITIDPATMQLTSVVANGKPLSLRNGPRPLNGPARTIAVWQPDPNSAEGQFASGLKMVRWTIDAAGRVRLEYQYEAGGKVPFTGVTFDYPEKNVKAKRWLGPGPFRVWGNRLEGGMLNVWQNDYNDSITGQTWQYPEFKGYFAGVRWMQLLTTEGTIGIVPHSDDLFLRVLTPGFPAAKLALATAVEFPPGDISILHTIPPIGAKQRKPPQPPPVPWGTYGATVDFYFSSK